MTPDIKLLEIEYENIILWYSEQLFSTGNYNKLLRSVLKTGKK